MAELKDSGARHEFDGGAMREVVEGKGRCDLLPLDVVGVILDTDEILLNINRYVRSGEIKFLEKAIDLFMGGLPVDPYTIVLDLAVHYEDGARKYADRNWEKGLPLSSFVDSGVRHYLKFLRGDTDEPHDRAFLWNMVGAIWTTIHKPSLETLPIENSNINGFGTGLTFDDSAPLTGDRRSCDTCDTERNEPCKVCDEHSHFFPKGYTDKDVVDNYEKLLSMAGKCCGTCGAEDASQCKICISIPSNWTRRSTNNRGVKNNHA